MERQGLDPIYRVAFVVFVLTAVAVIAFCAGILLSSQSLTAEAAESSPSKRVLFPKKTLINLDELRIDGELKKPSNFYFNRRGQEKFNSLVKRRSNFHREMLRDAVLNR